MSHQEFESSTYDAGDAPESSPPSPWQFLQDRMYGRWRYAIPLAIVTSVGGALAGFHFAPANYKATGYVQVDPIIEYALSSTPEIMPAYDAYVEKQIHLLKLGVVLEGALEQTFDDAPSGFSLKSAFPDAGAVGRALTVGRESRSTFIQVSIENDMPEPAYWMVRAILDAYLLRVAPEAEYEQRRQAAEGFRSVEESKMNELLARRENPQRSNDFEFAKYSDEMLSSEDRLYWEMFVNQMQVLEGLGIAVSPSDFAMEGVQPNLDQVSEANKSGQDGAADGTEGLIANTASALPTLAELEKIDPFLQVSRGNLNAANDYLEELRLSYGEDHFQVRSQRDKVKVLEQRLRTSEEDALRRWHEIQAGVAANETGQVPTVVARRDPNELIEKGRQIWRRIQVIGKEMERRREIDTEIRGIEARLARIDENLQKLKDNESTFRQGRVEIMPPAMPTAPEQTKKRQMTFAGFVGGFCLPIGMFMLLGHLDRRAFGSGQITSGQPYRCIGVMPDLSRLEETPDSHELASTCIHRLRNRLTLVQGGNEQRVIAVTSPFQGDGKTSLAFALAWSYASSGYRTVIVDADFVGQTLSAQVGRRNQPGFRELLKTQVLNGEVSRLLDGTPLSVIGVGCNDVMGAEGVTRENVGRLLSVLRERFEITIIDTGPLLGSVESLPIVSAADGVLLTLRRGRPKRRLDECVRELEVVGGNLLGVVLNCADVSECRRYASASHTSHRSMNRATADDSAGEEGGQPSAAMISLLGSKVSSGFVGAKGNGKEDQS